MNSCLQQNHNGSSFGSYKLTQYPLKSTFVNATPKTKDLVPLAFEKQMELPVLS